MTTAEQLALAILQTHAGPWYVAANDTQRARVLQQAVFKLLPLITEIEQKAAQRAVINST